MARALLEEDGEKVEEASANQEEDNVLQHVLFVRFRDQVRGGHIEE